MSELPIEIWSDIACPWCYVGKRRLEAALDRFPQRASVRITWRSFELDPRAPREYPDAPSHSERLARKYGTSLRETEARMSQLVALARADGLAFDFTRIRSGNTFDAHRVLHLAKQLGKQDAVEERFFRAYLCEGEAIGLPDVLQRLASEAGLDGVHVGEALASGAYADAVRADQEEARELGIRGVPFFLLNRRYAISGAQASDVLLAAMQRAFAELESEPPAFAEGAACGPDGCE